MHDGTTPLILAARLAVDGMVEELINCHADANATDDSGRPHSYGPTSTRPERCACLSKCNDSKQSYFSFTIGKSALHWAAAVNNVEAAVVLLKNGANKDMQDNKVCDVF